MKYFNEDFIKKCSKQDRKSQKQLFEQLYAPMYRVCLRYINQQADAEDCLMRGFMKVFQNLEKFRYEGEHSLFAWVQRIMINESLMFLRQRHNFVLSMEEKHNTVSLPEDVYHQLGAEDLYNIILQLPTGYRTVFNLNVVEGYNHSEIAEMLGVTESTSRTQLAKARNKLRILIEQTNLMYGQAGE
jgi:RNA polymerase sigma factor (sigma-70 family)